MNSRAKHSDFTGARGSNTGDVFHELWAVRHTLRLISSNDNLTAVKVEGVPTLDEAEGIWSGVDCTLLFGDNDASNAERVEIQQLKYSAASPRQKWTVSRVCQSSGRKVSDSLIAKLAATFSNLFRMREGKRLDTLKISFITNQPISAELSHVIDLARSGVETDAENPSSGAGPKLARLIQASGLEGNEFFQFCSVLNFRGESESRFAIEDSLLGEIAQWKESDFQDIANRLRNFVRNQMLPESAGELITKERVLLQFGISSESTLFPCPSKVKTLKEPVFRQIAKDVAKSMTEENGKVCIHGAAGVGKTTLLQEINELLPPDSQMIVFDCYGAGSYLDASRWRHPPRLAFVQLSNSISQQLGLPTYLVPSGNTDYAREFRRRLKVAAEVLTTTNESGLLVIAIDAADNSIAAARSRGTAESSFITELLTMNDLPSNVRIVITVRTGRLEQLRLPLEYRRVELKAFSEQETAANVKRYWNAPQTWIQDLHELSGGIPRVQDYVFERSSNGYESAVDYLLPHGKSLEVLFSEFLNIARNKAADIDSITRLCASLTILPRPIPLVELEHAICASALEVQDMCIDLAPGLRIAEGFVSFTDEDFETFVREQGFAFNAEVQKRCAERFLANAQHDEYAALNVTDQMFKTGIRKELLEFVEQESEPSPDVISDPILRREIQDHRLLTAARVCRAAGDIAQQLRFVLLAAEAMGNRETTQTLITDYPQLTAKFARDTGSRKVLESRDQIGFHGGLLSWLFAEDAATEDRIGAEENWRRLQAWIEDGPHSSEDETLLIDDCPVSGEDVAATVGALSILRGIDLALEYLESWEPREFRVEITRAFAKQLLTQNRFGDAEEIAKRCSPWLAPLLLVPLARAGIDIDMSKLAESVVALQHEIALNADLLGDSEFPSEVGSYLIDIALSAAEMLGVSTKHREVSQSIFEPFLDNDLRQIESRYSFAPELLDAILRAYCFQETLNGNQVDASHVLVANARREARSRHSYDHRRDQAKELVAAISSFYERRARAMCDASKVECEHLDLKGFGKYADDWRIERSLYAHRLRAMLAERLTDLIAFSARAQDVMERAWQFHRNLWPDGSSGVSELFNRLAATSSLHSELISKVTQAAARAKEEKNRASDRMRALAGFATILTPISKDDAKVVYGWAATVADELDTEAVHQIGALHKLIERGQFGPTTDKRNLALSVSEFVADAALRLEDEENFPWTEAMTSIVRLDVPVALSSVSRWDDSGLVGIHQTLPHVIAEGLRQSFFSRSQAASLAIMVEHPSRELLQSILSEPSGESNFELAQLAEEIARDILVGRTALNDSVLPLVNSLGSGSWTTALQAHAEFNKQEKNKTSQAQHNRRSGHAEFFENHTWDASKLLESNSLRKETERVFGQLRKECGIGHLGNVLDDAMRTISSGDRSKFLDALAGNLEHSPHGEVAEALLNASEKWLEQLAVGEWCKVQLPKLLAEHLKAFLQYFPWPDSPIVNAIQIIESASGDPLDGLLEGLERNIENMDAGQIFGVVGLIGSNIKPEESANLSTWYVERLFANIAHQDRELVGGVVLPTDSSEAVGRFLYAYMSDVDLRQRWRSAHALRRLARLGEDASVSETIAQYCRVEEPIFRARSEPFYWLAARLWLVIALDRIATEGTFEFERKAQELLEVCFDEKFPHVLIRDYAADACRKLNAAGKLDLSAAQIVKLGSVNRGRVSDQPTHSIPIRDWGRDRSNQRFRFDELDTVHYWYEDWFRVFDGATLEEFMKCAESWIVDNWGVTEEPQRSQSIREDRFSRHSYDLWSNSHGRLPTLETYKTHLEWHAMWCAAGELMQNHFISKSSYDDSDTLSYEISGYKLTSPPFWMSDLVGPPPLLEHRRPVLEQDVSTWLHDVNTDNYLRELFPEDRRGWVCVNAYISTSFGDRKEEVDICTGLVSPRTALALVRALQTTPSRYQFYVCPEEDDREIRDPEYELRGWLTESQGDPKFDKKDPFCGACGSPSGLPGKRVSEVLRLKKCYCNNHLEWFREGAESSPSLVFETWGIEELEERTTPHGYPPTSFGHRLLIRRDDLAEFLRAAQRDLITDIGITRYEQKRFGASANTESSRRGIFDRIILFRQVGELECAEQSLAPWYINSS